MDSKEKIAIGGSLVLMTIFFGAVVLATTSFGVKVPDCITDRKPFEESAIIRIGPNHYEVHSIARMWYFDPFMIEVPPGSEVDLYLTSADVVHGFQIENKNVNLMAIPGQVNYAKVKFEKEGEYRIVCHEYCGINHQTMAGVVKVQRIVESAAEEGSNQ